jgi:hypothetical protein
MSCHLSSALERGICAALQDGDLISAEHLCAADLRNRREQTERLLHQAHLLQSQNPVTIEDTNYCKRDYLVTALVSTYAAERFIRGRLENLLDQSLGDRLEILVLDSGSPEEEGDVVREYQRNASNIRYLRTDRRESIYQAWNRGVALARGRYLTNANADDRLRHDALEVMTELLEQNPGLGLCYGDSLLTTTPNETFAASTAYNRQSHPDYSPNALLEWCITGSHPLWRRELHQTSGLFDIAWRSAGDYDFFIRASRHWPFIHIPEPLGLVWTSMETFSGKGHLPLLEFYAIRQQYRDYLQPVPSTLPALDEQALTHYLVEQGGGLDAVSSLLERYGQYPQVQFSLAGMYHLAGDQGGEWRHLQRAFYLEPANATYRQALDDCLARNLRQTIQSITQQDPALVQSATGQTLGQAAQMLKTPAIAIWSWMRCLQQLPDDAVSLAKLQRLPFPSE